ncbi:MAG TPA: hypothetical protein VGW31_14060, partial [Hanamia sp.]|nr:hypothetical protein [Hanamia sp.]
YRVVLISILFLSACTSQTGTISKNTDRDPINSNEMNKSSSIDGCYISTFNKDTAHLKLTINNNEVSGNLVYDRFEKDGNVGTIKGRVRDSLIIADYTFQSEGMTSVREVVFKIKDENLIEGYGDIVMKSDTAAFKNITQLKFHDEQPFLKEECK